MDQEFMKEKPVMPLVISMALPMTSSPLQHKNILQHIQHVTTRK